MGRIDATIGTLLKSAGEIKYRNFQWRCIAWYWSHCVGNDEKFRLYWKCGQPTWIEHMNLRAEHEHQNTWNSFEIEILSQDTPSRLIMSRCCEYCESWGVDYVERLVRSLIAPSQSQTLPSLLEEPRQGHYSLMHQIIIARLRMGAWLETRVGTLCSSRCESGSRFQTFPSSGWSFDITFESDSAVLVCIMKTESFAMSSAPGTHHTDIENIECFFTIPSSRRGLPRYQLVQRSLVTSVVYMESNGSNPWSH